MFFLKHKFRAHMKTTNILRVHMEEFPTKYLGFPLTTIGMGIGNWVIMSGRSEALQKMKVFLESFYGKLNNPKIIY
jgi:hypothetical protein